MCTHLWNWFVSNTARHKSSEEREARQAVVPVRVDEVVAGDPLGIHVVLAESADEVGSDDGGLCGPEVVHQEVYEPGEQVRDQIRQDHDTRQEPQVVEVRDPLVDVHNQKKRGREEGHDPA